MLAMLLRTVDVTLCAQRVRREANVERQHFDDTNSTARHAAPTHRAQERRARKLKDAGHQDGLLHGQGLGAHGGAERVGDIVGANAVGLRTSEVGGGHEFEWARGCGAPACTCSCLQAGTPCRRARTMNRDRKMPHTKTACAGGGGESGGACVSEAGGVRAALLLAQERQALACWGVMTLGGARARAPREAIQRPRKRPPRGARAPPARPVPHTPTHSTCTRCAQGGGRGAVRGRGGVGAGGGMRARAAHS